MASEEFLDIVDQKGRLTGVSKPFSEVHRDALLHHCAHVWIYTPKKEILFQHRSRQKRLKPNLWDTGAAGHIQAGETALEGALRESYEEIGIRLIPENLQYIDSTRGAKPYIRHGYYENEFQVLYTYKMTESINDIRIDPNEVAGVQLLAVDAFLKELKSSDFLERFVDRAYFERMAQWVKNLG